MYYVYKITNIINGKFYIGKRKHNFPEKDSYMGSGKLIQAAIKKYGLENFTKEILGTFQTNDEAANLEKSLVTRELVESNMCYNMHEGGHGGFAHINNTPIEERPNIISLRAKIKSGELKIGGDTSMYFTEDSYMRMRAGSAKGNQTLRNKPIEEKQVTYKKISEAGSGEGNSQYGTKICVNLETGEKKRFKEVPDGWIASTELTEQLMENSRRWYNDGTRNFYIYLTDSKIVEMALVKGRIKQRKP